MSQIRQMHAGGTGYSFVPATPACFADALNRCLRLYRDQPKQWKQLQQAGMAQDWSWRRSAVEYERLYRDVVQRL